MLSYKQVERATKFDAESAPRLKYRDEIPGFDSIAIEEAVVRTIELFWALAASSSSAYGVYSVCTLLSVGEGSR